MKNKKQWLKIGILSAAITLSMVMPTAVFADTPQNGWYEENGAKYWYENGVCQGYDASDASYRGKEIYDPESDAWYWLDNVQSGAVAVSKDVYQESLAGAWGDYIGEDGERYGKWVRYDENGHMIKGWQYAENGTYFFDYTYGTMAKGYATIEGKEYYFNKDTGVLEREIGEVPENGWKNIDGNDYWYEGYVRQGYSVDASYRGKEIYDPASDAWYWLDNVDGGKKAISKDVYQESLAGEWGDYVGTDGQHYGKWVRYDDQGHMIKGWSEKDGNRYYFDPVYGTMAKGKAVIDGRTYQFYQDTGILESDPYECNLDSDDYYYKYEYAYKTGDMSVLSDDDMAFYKGLKACLDEAYKGTSLFEQELAVHDYMVLNCEYDYDNYRNGTIPEESFTPEGVFVQKKAVCEGYAEGFMLCMDILGIPCEMVTGFANGGGHAWNIVQLDGEWYMVDVTWDDPVPDKKGYVRYDCFNVTDAKLGLDHFYEYDIKADGTKYQYYEYMYRDACENGDAFVAKAKEWAVNAKNGDTIELAVKNRECEKKAFYDKYINQLNKSNVIVKDLTEAVGPLAVGEVHVLSLTKHTTLEEYMEEAKAWGKDAGPNDSLAVRFTYSYVAGEQENDWDKYEIWLRENGMFLSESLGCVESIPNLVANTETYDFIIRKAYTLKDVYAELAEWTKTAKGADTCEWYFPVDEVEGEENSGKFVENMDKFNSLGLYIYDSWADNRSYYMAFKMAYKPEEMDQLLAEADAWYKDSEKENDYYTYIKVEEENIGEESKNTDAKIKEWAVGKNVKPFVYSSFKADTYSFVIVWITME